MDQLTAFDNTLALALERGMPHTSPITPRLGLDHLIKMRAILAENPDWPADKVGRWLGWAQCAVVAAGKATDKEMEDINRHAKTEG